MNPLSFYRYALQAPQNTILWTKTVSVFPKVLHVLKKYVTRYTHDVEPILKRAAQIPVIAVNGILTDGKGDVYSMFVNTPEEIQHIFIRDESGNQTPFVPDLGPDGCAILMSDHRLNESAFLNTLLVHELSHFVRNSFFGENTVVDYEDDPAEEEARKLEAAELQSGEGMSKREVDRFLFQKYYPKAN